MRRVSFDLRGLPPTTDEFEQFIHDKDSNAFEKAVDRFLADPAFGERWARMWLDQARYADSAGYGSDPLRPNIWPYRDWVIRAFNRNLHFDEFTIDQIAGDLLPEPSLETKIATAFHRNTMTNTEGGTDDEEFRVAAIKDRVDTTMQVWMGLTMGCAKCHSHKYDPITHTEYYQFYAFFNQTGMPIWPARALSFLCQIAQILAQIERIDAEIAPLRQKLDAFTPELGGAQAKWESSLGPAGSAARKALPKEIRAILDIAADKRTKLQTEKLTRYFRSTTPELKPVSDKIAALEKSKPKIPSVPVMVELPADHRRVTRVLKKGNFLDPGDEVRSGVPQSLHRLHRRLSQEPTWAGAVARRSGEPFDGTRGRQSLLGTDLRRGTRRNRRRLRHSG